MQVEGGAGLIGLHGGVSMWCGICGALIPSATGPCPVCDGAGSSAGQHGGACQSARELGGLAMREAGETQAVRGRTPGGLSTTGRQRLYEVTGLGPPIWLAVLTWQGGEQEARRARRYLSAGWQDRLLGRPRLEVTAWGADHCSVELGLAGRDPALGLVVEDASEYALDAAARTCVRCALAFEGATAFGTRQEVLGVSDARRHRLCAVFPASARRIPALALALTHVAPVLNRARARSA